MHSKDELYRLESRLVSSGVDEWDNPLGPPSVEVYCLAFPVIKRTPKGAWIDVGWGDKRFVLLEANKRFACPTKAEALQSFIARKRKQIRILRARAEQAEQAMNNAMSLYGSSHTHAPGAWLDIRRDISLGAIKLGFKP